jgi:hypothetical protein
MPFTVTASRSGLVSTLEAAAAGYVINNELATASTQTNESLRIERLPGAVDDSFDLERRRKTLKASAPLSRGTLTAMPRVAQWSANALPVANRPRDLRLCDGRIKSGTLDSD